MVCLYSPVYNVFYLKKAGNSVKLFPSNLEPRKIGAFNCFYMYSRTKYHYEAQTCLGEDQGGKN
jgi:hypothetical protein